MRAATSAAMAALAILLGGTAAATAKKPSKLWASHLTKKAFERAEPRLQSLEPGTALRDTGIRWEYYKIVERRKTAGVRAESDGWIGFLSGGPRGAIGGLGGLRGVSEEYLYGEHVFGYLWKNATLVPRYVVTTRARRSSEAENENISSGAVGSAGRVESGGRTFFYRNVTVEGVREARFTPPEDSERTRTQKLPSGDLESFFARRSSPESYAGIVPKIRSLKTGCHLLDAVGELGGLYMTVNFGRDYFLLLDGYLGMWMKPTDYPTATIGDTWKYEVWPFGYLENEEPQVQLALVFRNGALVTVLEDGSRDAVQAYVAARQ